MYFMDGWGIFWEGKGILFEDKCMYVFYERVRERKDK